MNNSAIVKLQSLAMIHVLPELLVEVVGVGPE